MFVVFGLFALWSNLHAGFAFGLILFGIYGGFDLAQKRWKAAGKMGLAISVGVAGTLGNPYGLGPYRVAWQHWLMRHDLSLYIKEWHPLTLENPLHWPLGLMLTLLAGLILYCLFGRLWRRISMAPMLAAIYLGANTLAHERVAAYFNTAAVVLIFLLIKELGFLDEMRRLKKAVFSIFLGYAVFLLWLLPRISWAGLFNYKYVPRQAAGFLAQEQAIVRSLRIFNQWEWGGYLGWRLYPWYKVSCDGRYIFHDQLAQTAKAASDSGLWQKYLEKESMEGALLQNLDVKFSTRKAYPDGKTRLFLRPWYLFYMPRERWALVYWDDQALFFVDRHAVASDWLMQHEYRYLHPGDDAAFQEALRLGEIMLKKLSEERHRHRVEVGRQD